ncbi:MAG TPA: hypothetical protein DHV62_10970 [Elusimicrobia bacterium]|jgi:CRP-like cAMP-binding protein|nr:hypothetical protein [Elusimicrobiota bacterium]
MSVKLKVLHEVPLFSHLSPNQLKKIAQLLHQQKFSKKTVIFTEKEYGNAFYIILSGMVKIYKLAPDGRRKILAILRENDFFGEMAELDKTERSAYAEAFTDTELLKVKRKDFEIFLKTNPHIMFEMLQTLSARLRRADEEIKNLVSQTVSGRIAYTILDLAKKYGKKTKEGIRISFPLTHQEIAELVGNPREVVTKTINEFEKRDYLLDKEKYLILANREALEKIVLEGKKI